jgi:hypothetical protein
MKPYYCDYESIESRVREAKRLRSEATGELTAAAWRRIKEFASSFLNLRRERRAVSLPNR